MARNLVRRWYLAELETGPEWVQVEVPRSALARSPGARTRKGRPTDTQSMGPEDLGSRERFTPLTRGTEDPRSV